MDEQTKPEDVNHTRKTITVPTKPVLWGGGILGALAIMAQLKGAFITREEGDSVQHQLTMVNTAITELKTEYKAGNAETIRILERSTDKILDRMKDDRVSYDNRLGNLEFVVLNKQKHNK